MSENDLWMEALVDLAVKVPSGNEKEKCMR
jgi:hypothetical protein